MTTLRDLARRLDLSVTQVSRALNGHADVAAGTRARVQAEARAQGYHPNAAARRLATGRSGMLGLVLPDVPREPEDRLFVQIVGTLSQHLSRLGRQFVLHIADPHDDIVEVHRRLIGGGAFDGFVVLEPEARDRRVEFLRRRGVPFVIHGRVDGVDEHARFDIDNEGVGQRLTAMLLEAGHERVAFLNGPERLSFAQARRRGFLRALAAAGLPEGAGLHRFGAQTEGAGLLAAVELWGGGDAHAPMGVACGSTRLALGLLRGLDALGLSVPRDVSVVVHEDEFPGLRAGGLCPALAGTRAPLAEAWPHLARLLVSAADGARPDGLRVEGEVADMPGASVAAPRRRRVDGHVDGRTGCDTSGCDGAARSAPD